METKLDQDREWVSKTISYIANWVALIAYYGGDYKSGIPWTDRAIEADPENWFAHATKGELLFEIGEHEDAFKMLRTCLENGIDFNPNDALRASLEFQKLCLEFPNVLDEK